MSHYKIIGGVRLDRKPLESAERFTRRRGEW